MTRADAIQDEKCVWMEAGVLTYKLCDRAYDCERCPLDAVLRHRERDSQTPMGSSEDAVSIARPLPLGCDPSVTRILERHQRSELRTPLLYSPWGSWVRLFDDRIAIIGIDDNLASFLPSGSIIVFPPLDAEIRRGQPLAWIYIDDAVLHIPAPLTGNPVRRNPQLGSDAMLVHTSPYDLGWLLSMTPTRLEQERGMLHTAAEIEPVLAQRMDTILSRASRVLGAREIISGPCLNDGGTPVPTLLDALGPKALIELLSSTLFIRGGARSPDL